MSLQGDPGPHDDSEIDHPNWMKMFVQNLTLKRFFSFFVHVQLEDQIGHFK
jgi:hypothetical protein